VLCLLSLCLEHSSPRSLHGFLLLTHVLVKASDLQRTSLPSKLLLFHYPIFIFYGTYYYWILFYIFVCFHNYWLSCFTRMR
jgi:hypothetical protein